MKHILLYYLTRFFWKYQESETEIQDISSIASSETVPSFAKVRYSIDSEEVYIYGEGYDRSYMEINMESQRILIRQPKKAGKLAKLSTFYFTEVLCESPHLSELGEFQS